MDNGKIRASCDSGAVRTSLETHVRMEAKSGDGIFQYIFRTTRKNRVSRATSPKFIGRTGMDFCCGDAYLARFGLRIMNPPL